jgi:hypothetical protein
MAPAEGAVMASAVAATAPTGGAGMAAARVAVKMVVVGGAVNVDAKLGRHLRAAHVTSRSLARCASQSDLLIDSGKILGIDSRTDGLVVVWTSLGPLPRWVPGPTTRWAPGTTRLALHGI